MSLSANRRSVSFTKHDLLTFGSILTLIKARFYYERGKEHSLFILLIFFALASILTARFNRRSIKETKNALFHARSGNGP